MKILAFKGGGIRGLLSARLGERLEEFHPGWSDKADLLAGTSTGGIIALAIAAGIPWKQIVALYRDKAPRIFADSAWDNLTDVSIGGVSLRGAQYSSEGLHDVLTETFGTLRLGDLKRAVLIPAFDLDGGPGQWRGVRAWQAKFFDREHDGNELVVDVAMRTSAAPTYFPSWQGYVDGGVVANDPSICALAHGLRRMKDPLASLLVGGVSLLTVRTGAVPKFIEGETSNDWGALEWVRHLLDLLMDGGLLVPVYQAVTVLGDRYHELNPILPREIPLDGDAWDGEDELEENVAALKALADEADLGKTARWLETNGWVGR